MTILKAFRFPQGAKDTSAGNSLVCVPCGPVIGQNHTAKITLHGIVAHLVQEPTQGRLGSKRSIKAVRWLPGVFQKRPSFSPISFCAVMRRIAFRERSPGGSVCPVWSERPTSLSERLAMESFSVDTTVAASEAL